MSLPQEPSDYPSQFNCSRFPMTLNTRTSLYSLLLGFLLVTGTSLSAWAQLTSFASLEPQFKAFQQKNLQEKLFVHLDRTAYVCGEVMWMKLYNVEGTHHRPSDLSKVAYVEVLDGTNKPVLQGKIDLKNGAGSGSFALPVTLPSGYYTLRAYTNWMKNFSPEFYFHQQVTIINTFQPLGLRQQKDSSAFSLRFFPEGGNLVNGLRGKVAFQALNQKTGKGADCQGEILNNQGKVIASFASARNGIWHFTFTPVLGEEYTAIARFANGKVLQEKLPAILVYGYTLEVTSDAPEMLTISAQSNTQQAEQVYLLGHSRQQVVLAATGLIENGKTRFFVKKDSLLAGITHFTLFNSQKKPVAERLYFKRPTEQLEIDAALSHNQVGVREKVTLTLLSSARPGMATPANLSVSVFKTDSLPASSNDIKAFLWLSSDLKGSIENAAAYLENKGPQADQDLDNLMLTHGWTRFTWQSVLGQTTPTYSFLPEFNGHLVQATVKDRATGAPAKGIRTFLASPGKQVKFNTNVSGVDGNVLFDVKDFYGPREVILQTNFRKDSTYSFELSNPFSETYAARPLPFFDVAENLGQALSLRHIDIQAQNIYFEKYLNQFKAPAIDTLPIYGAPNQLYFLDNFTRFKVLEEVLREYVPGVMVRKREDGFHFRVMDHQRKLFFQEDPLVLIDAIPVFNINEVMAFDPLKIKRLDVVTSNFFTGSLASPGVVSFTTYKGDLANFPLDPKALLQEYDGLQLQREFYAPTYETEEQKNSRLPDWRNLLYWNPTADTDSQGKASMHFYTADQPGTYTILVQGITAGGLPGSKTVSFQVKKPL
ncbi:hypothetical protein [Rufibacter soli]